MIVCRRPCKTQVVTPAIKVIQQELLRGSRTPKAQVLPYTVSSPAALQHRRSGLPSVSAADFCISQRQVARLLGMLKAGCLKKLTGFAIRCPRGRPVPGCPVHRRVAGRDAIGKPLRCVAVGGAIWQRLRSRRAQRGKLILGKQRASLCALGGCQPMQHKGSTALLLRFVASALIRQLDLPSGKSDNTTEAQAQAPMLSRAQQGTRVIDLMASVCLMDAFVI